MSSLSPLYLKKCVACEHLQPYRFHRIHPQSKSITPRRNKSSSCRFQSTVFLWSLPFFVFHQQKVLHQEVPRKFRALGRVHLGALGRVKNPTGGRIATRQAVVDHKAALRKGNARTAAERS